MAGFFDKYAFLAFTIQFSPTIMAVVLLLTLVKAAR
jgi:hypothetical protein